MGINLNKEDIIEINKLKEDFYPKFESAQSERKKKRIVALYKAI